MERNAYDAAMENFDHAADALVQKVDVLDDVGLRINNPVWRQLFSLVRSCHHRVVHVLGPRRKVAPRLGQIKVCVESRVVGNAPERARRLIENSGPQIVRASFDALAQHAKPGAKLPGQSGPDFHPRFIPDSVDEWAG